MNKFDVSDIISCFYPALEEQKRMAAWEKKREVMKSQLGIMSMKEKLQLIYDNDKTAELIDLLFDLLPDTIDAKKEIDDLIVDLELIEVEE